MRFVVAAVVLERDGHVLTVRKRGTERFMLPGGKLEPGESAAEAAVREIAEEVGLRIDGLRLLGELVADAANEPGYLVESTVFVAPLTGEPEPREEIEEIRWIPLEPSPDGPPLAPLLEHEVLPLLRASAAAAASNDGSR